MCRRFAVAGLLAAVLGVVGCSAKPVKVGGTVTLDGTPVEGATVTFMSEDGLKTYGGSTDAAGKFELAGNGVEGALPGNYKVLVVKSKTIAGGENMDPMSDEYKKAMAGMMKEDAKAAAKGSTTTPMKMPGGAPPMMGKMMPPGGGMMMPGAGGPGNRSELPAIYASGEKTPLKASVGPNGEPNIELKLVGDKKDEKKK